MNADFLSALYEADDALDKLRRKFGAELSWSSLREIERAQLAIANEGVRELAKAIAPRAAS